MCDENSGGVAGVWLVCKLCARILMSDMAESCEFGVFNSG